MKRNIRAVAAALAVAVVGSSASASVIDSVQLQTQTSLTFTDSTGVFYSLIPTQPTDAGTFDPFVRIKRDSQEQGYNSSVTQGKNATLDDIALPAGASSQLPLSNIVTSDHKITLALDYHQPDPTALFLAELTLVVSTDSNKTSPAGPGSDDPWSLASIPLSAGDQILYQMSATTDEAGNPYQIELDNHYAPTAKQGGNPDLDMTVTFDLSNLPNLAALTDGNHYLYIYSHFISSEGGFEQWSAYNVTPGGGTGAPEPASLGVMALGAMGLLARRRRRIAG